MDSSSDINGLLSLRDNEKENKNNRKATVACNKNINQ